MLCRSVLLAGLCAYERRAEAMKTNTTTPSAPAAGSGERCPHCGGDTGFSYKVTIRGVQWMKWDGTGVSFDDSDTRRGAKRCLDCNRIVRKNPNRSGGEKNP